MGSGATGEKCGIWDRLSHNAPDSDSPINQFCVKLPHLIASWASCKVLTRSLDILLLRDHLSHNFNRVRNLLSKFYCTPIEAKYCEHHVENNFPHPHKASMLHERKGYGLLAQTTDNKWQFGGDAMEHHFRPNIRNLLHDWNIQRNMVNLRNSNEA